MPLLVQIAPEATVSIVPERIIPAIPPQTTLSFPAFTIGAGLMVTSNESVNGVQELSGLSERIIFPAEISAADGR